MKDKILEGADWLDHLDPTLFNPTEDFFGANPSFEATLSAHGKYETRRFVLRLSPRNHELMEGIEDGLYENGGAPPEVIQAYSTYIHETIHWWQHVGSTSGMLLSLTYLAQSHSTMGHLKAVLKEHGAIKPLKRWADEVLMHEGDVAQAKLADANIARVRTH